MGTTCCIKPPSKHTHFPSPQLQQIHITSTPELLYPSSQAHIHTKRTSQPSLLPLNNQITRMINTFQKCHGMITNSFTRTNTVMVNSLTMVQNVKYYGEDISEIIRSKGGVKQGKYGSYGNQMEKMELALPSIKENKESQLEKQGEKKFKNCNKENVTSKIQSSSDKKSSKVMQLPIGESDSDSDGGRDSDSEQTNLVPKIKLKSESGNNNKLQLDVSDSSSWEEDNEENSENLERGEEQEESSNLLDKSLINEDVYKEKQELIKEYNQIQGIILEEWSNDTFQKFSMSVKELLKHTFCPINSAALSSIVVYYEKFEILLSAYRKCNQKSLVKMHINGQKRLISVENNHTSAISIFNEALENLYTQNDIPTTPCNQVYHLSGWVPEVLYLGQIQNKDNLWDRLVENFNDGNIVITFGCGIEEETFMTLESINIVTSDLKLICTISDEGCQGLEMKEVSWNELLEIVDAIYINWNPSIYNFIKKIDAKWTSKLLPFENQAICLENNPQYLIKIPKHSQDFEIRVFADRYIKKFNQASRLCLKLFEYNGSRILSPQQAVRTLQVDSRELISDVFIFQKSETVDYFVLAVLSDDEEILENQEIAFSLLFLSFVDVEVKELPKREILKTNNIASKVTKEHIGYGLNSPDFFKNLQYSLKVSPESCLQIQVEGSPECEFTLILIQDKNSRMDLAKIDFQTILNQSTMSQVFQQYGFIQKQVASEYYILVIALIRCSQNSKFKITTNTSSKLYKRNRQLQACFSSISIQQLTFQPVFIKEIDIKWKLTDPGPRKRLKHTSTQVVYHPASVFQQFLKNPHLIIKLEKGNYQFNLICDNYRRQFYKNQHSEGQPPALSIAVLKNSQNNKGYKIVIDDAFYVPIGYGFWTPELLLEQGRYTIVCARVEKKQGEGKLRIRKV